MIVKQIIQSMIRLLSARISIKYANWRTWRKLARLNRAHMQSDYILGESAPGIDVSLIISGIVIAICAITVLYVANH
jgi:hypothetical protein